MQIIKFNVIDSTHNFALRMLNKNAAPRECAIVALRQTRGIGRCNRRWISPEGNLFTSIIKRSPPYRDIGKISLTVACAVRDTVAHFIGDSPDLTFHWPNDVYYKNLKISGILMAVVGDWMVISVGINVCHAPSNLSATCIRDILLQSKRDLGSTTAMTVFDLLNTSIDSWLLVLEKLSFSCIRSYWLRNINEFKCNVILRNGNESISGLFYDLDECGRLVLERDGKHFIISSGDLFLNQEGILVNNEEKI
ncbi:MAG: biotin--[acetyl-CoA-carboxylase] ligase [Holosporaceae bacterium]|jgi:BirA family biotin operon repressor/biotin-[acetyl-CoA-carboxylase] ligase|nr:biotin--[acetyl-CoA-carboxylase] ligase [Holosporaceae bacterium]